MTERTGYHVSYDDAGSVQIDEATHAPMAGDGSVVPSDGLGCHSGSTMKEAAREAGQSELTGCECASNELNTKTCEAEKQKNTETDETHFRIQKLGLMRGYLLFLKDLQLKTAS